MCPYDPFLRNSWFVRAAHGTEKKMFYLLDYWFLTKGKNSGTARWKWCLGQGMREGASKPSLSSLLSQHLHVSTNPEAHQTPSFRVFMEASLRRHGWWSHWPWIHSTFSLFRGGGRFPPSHHSVGSSGSASPSVGLSKGHLPRSCKLWCGWKGLSVNNEDVPFTFTLLELFRTWKQNSAL